MWARRSLLSTAAVAACASFAVLGFGHPSYPLPTSSVWGALPPSSIQRMALVLGLLSAIAIGLIPLRERRVSTAVAAFVMSGMLIAVAQVAVWRWTG